MSEDTAWRPANNGTGKRIWLLIKPDSVPLAERYHNNSQGFLIRYASYATALAAAKKLNR